MTAPLALLADTTDPRQRARLLTLLATTEDTAGHHARARLAAIVADSELLLADPGHEPTDPAWDDDIWHPLAHVASRTRRAAILERIHDDWARPRFGADAVILLALAETERDAAIPPTGPCPADIVLSAPEDDVGDEADEQSGRGPVGLPAAAAFWLVAVAVSVVLIGVVALSPSLTAKMSAAAVLPVLILIAAAWRTSVWRA